MLFCVIHETQYMFEKIAAYCERTIKILHKDIKFQGDEIFKLIETSQQVND